VPGSNLDNDLAHRKEMLRLRGRIERAEAASHLLTLRRLKEPANFAVVGSKIFKFWRGNPATTLLASRGIASGRLFTALRYAGFAVAAWQTWRAIKSYTGSRRV
jgi:hypothetical protein